MMMKVFVDDYKSEDRLTRFVQRWIDEQIEDGYVVGDKTVHVMHGRQTSGDELQIVITVWMELLQ